MNRGINGDEIFSGSKNKTMFLDLLEDAARKLKIPIIGQIIQRRQSAHSKKTNQSIEKSKKVKHRPRFPYGV